MPVRHKITRRHRGDRPRAQGLIAGTKDVGHVIAEAGSDADALRAFIANDLGAVAQIKQNPGRAGHRSIAGHSPTNITLWLASTIKSDASAAWRRGAKRPFAHSGALTVWLVPRHDTLNEDAARGVSRLIERSVPGPRLHGLPLLRDAG